MIDFIEDLKRFFAMAKQLQVGGQKQILKIFGYLCLVVVCTSATAQQDTDGTWTLPRLINFALDNNKQIGAKELATKKREQSVLVAEGQNLPSVDFVTFLNAYPVNERLLIERHGFRPSNPFEDVILNYGLQLTFPLYTGGRLKEEINLAEAGVKIALARTNLSRQELIFNVTSGYYTYLKLQSVLDANEGLLRSVMESRRIAAQQLAVGRTAKLDLLKLDTRVSSARTQLVVVRNAVDRTLSALSALLGLPPGTGLNIVGNLQVAVTSTSIDEAQFSARLERQDLIAIRAEIKAQKHLVEIARSKFSPQLNSSVFLGGYTGNSGETQSDAKIFINLRMPLYSGNSLQSKERETLFRLQELQLRLEYAERNAMAEVEQALIELNSTWARLDTGLLSVELAQEALRIERQKFQQGRGTGNDLLLAEEVVLRAKTEYAAAQSDSQLALAALRFATGQIQQTVGNSQSKNE
ncbi:MAG: TolC family protein [Gammaproteobacteria bacterium]|nr:TolC family protein [Gammaproteobacteria bacterium]